MQVRSEFNAGAAFHCDLVEMLDLAYPLGEPTTRDGVALMQRFNELAHVVSLMLEECPRSLQRHALGSLLGRVHLTLQEKA